MDERIGEKLKDSKEKQKSLVSHFVGNWLLKVTLTTKDGGNTEGIKNSLIEKLESAGKRLILNEVLELIRNSDWSKKEGLENFREEYLRFKDRL